MRPTAQLPDDIKQLQEPPFTVQWQPVVTLVQLSSRIRPEPLKETLRRKEQARTPDMFDLSLRLDLTTPLGQEVRAAQEEHVVAGGTWDSFM